MVVGLFAHPGEAQVQDGLALSFEGPSDCGSSEELSARVEQVVASERPAAVSAQVAITREGDHFTLRVAFPARSREVTNRDCRALFDAAVAMIAVEARAVLEQQAAPPAPPIAPAVVPAPAEPSREHARTRSASAWLEGGAVHGLVPGVSARVGAGAALGDATWAGLVGLDYVPPRTTDDGYVRMQVLEARLGARFSPLARLWLGAGLEGSLLLGRGQDLAINREAAITRAALRLEAGGALVRRGRHGLWLVGGGAVAVHRARFEISRFGTAYQPALFSAFAELRWSVEFFQ
jgi:hypothetical protein